MAPTPSSRYVAYRRGTCTADHIRCLPTAFPEGKKSPAQEGRAEGHPVGATPLNPLYAPSLERLQQLCEHLALQRAARVVACTGAASVFVHS